MDAQTAAQNTDPRNLYPSFDISLVHHYLELNRPVWYLGLDGVLRASNLLAFWLWGAVRPTDTVLQVQNLLGINLFRIYSRSDNFQRIIRPESVDDDSADFIRKKLSVARGMVAAEGETDKDTIEACYAFINTVRQAAENDPVLQLIYETTEPNQALEWTYSLKIQSPDNPSELLEFTGTVARVYSGNNPLGYIAIYRALNKQTVLRVGQEYDRLRERFGEAAYVQYLNEDVKRLLTGTVPQSTVEGSAYISLLITEDPLTARNLATIITVLTELHTKLWLIQEEKFAELNFMSHYSYTGDPSFDTQAPLVINRLSHNTPTWIELISYVLSATGGLAVLARLIDAVIQAPLRFQEKKLDIEKKRADYLIEEINKTLELTNKYPDPATRQAVVTSLLPTLYKLGEGQGLQQALLVVNHDATKGTQSQ